MGGRARFFSREPHELHVDTVKGLMISGGLSNLPIDLVSIAVFDAVMFVLASISFKRIIE